VASQKNLVFLQNKETGEIYHTRKNKKLVERKLKYKKFSRKLRKNVWFEEVKKPAKLKTNTNKTDSNIRMATNNTNKKGIKKIEKKVTKTASKTKEVKAEKKTKTAKKAEGNKKNK
jgi:ribosomal protein L33